MEKELRELYRDFIDNMPLEFGEDSTIYSHENLPDLSNEIYLLHDFCIMKEKTKSKSSRFKYIKQTTLFIFLILLQIQTAYSYEGVSGTIIANNEDNYFLEVALNVKSYSLTTESIKQAMYHKESKLYKFAETCNDTAKTIPYEDVIRKYEVKYRDYNSMHNPVGSIMEIVKYYNAP